MPAKYEAMRDKFFEEKKEAWKSRNADKALTAKIKNRLYDAAQGKAARIFNSQRRGGQRPVTGSD